MLYYASDNRRPSCDAHDMNYFIHFYVGDIMTSDPDVLRILHVYYCPPFNS